MSSNHNDMTRKRTRAEIQAYLGPEMCKIISDGIDKKYGIVRTQVETPSPDGANARLFVRPREPERTGLFGRVTEEVIGVNDHLFGK